MRGYFEGYIDPIGSIYFLAKKFVSTTRKIKRQRLLTESEFNNFGKNNNNVGSTFKNDFSFQKHGTPLKWNLKNEVRYCSKAVRPIKSLRNSFGEISKEQKLQNSNHKFSQLGDVFQHRFSLTKFRSSCKKQ